MTHCNRFTPEQIAAFNDDELGTITAWCMSRHIAHCDACTQELTELKVLNSLLVSADVAPKTHPQSISVTTKKKLLYRRRALVSGFLGASIVSAAIITGVAFFGGGLSGRPSFAFTDVERSMAEVKTACWRKTRIDYDDATGKEMRRTVVDEKLRMYPTGHASRTVYSFAADTPNRSGYTGRAISDAVSVLWYVPETKEAVFRTQGNGKIQKNTAFMYTLPRIPNALKQEEVWRKTILRYLFSEPTAYQGKYGAWVAENTLIDGQSVVLFKRQVQSGRPKAPYVTNTISRIWVDPKTRRVIQKETSETMAETGKLRMLVREEDYHYNIPIKDSDFSLNIPANVPIVTRPYFEGIK